MLKLDDKEIKQFERELKTFADRAFPFATKNTLNRAAFEARKIAQNNISSKMVERNRFTKQSVRVEQARTLDVRRQSSTVGSTADYMEKQEFGGTERRGGSEGIAIPTSFAAGQEGQQPRTRVPRKANKLQNIRLQSRRVKASSRRQRNLVAIQQAATTSSKFVFLDLGRRKGIFKVTGGKRRPRIKMVHDLTRQTIRIPRNPWLKPAVDKTQLLIPGFYRDSLLFQLKRNKLFTGGR